jgi:glucosylceramidase
MTYTMRVFIKQLLPVVFILATACGQENGVSWIQTTGEAQWVVKDGPALSGVRIEGSQVIRLDPGDQRQAINGFGACFNELGWEALKLAPERDREVILRNLFDPDTGCRFNICRMPVGANDYAVDWYSQDEEAGDLDMKHFSIERDRLRLIPYIRAAKEINPDFRLWASPWCPPSWMKENDHYACRSDPQVNDLPPGQSGQEMVTQFIMEPPVLSAYALYFSKFIKAYSDEEIPIYAVHVQNEPNSCQNFPSCIWRPEDLATFIGSYLGPRFEQEGLDTEIWLGTVERPQLERVEVILQDERARSYIKGVGFQWAGKEVIGEVHRKYPGMPLMQTESECGDGSNNWDALEYTFSLMKHYFTHGAEAYLYWNMVLDETGRSRWGWKQNSLITVGPGGEVTYNPEYYLMKHLASAVDPGARYLGLSEEAEDCLAFMNPGGEVVVMLLNPGDSKQLLALETGTGNYLNLELPPKSLHTVKFLP